MNKSKTNRNLILVLVVVFVLPFVLAKFALDFDWLEKGATNKGELIAEPLQLEKLGVPAEGKWRLFYVVPENCSVECENALLSLNQVWVALGKDMDRAEAVAFVTENTQENVQSQIEKLANVRLAQVRNQNVNEMFKDVPSNGIFVADTLGNVMLRYPLRQDIEQAKLHSRDILADMRKLMKLSRIG